MSREVRRVPADWKHPKRADGRYMPLFEGQDVAALQKAWDEEEKLWRAGKHPDQLSDFAEGIEKQMSFKEWHGGRARGEDYMPNWPEHERTHYMMYECTSEGTPISPAFPTPEELARWLVDNNASASGDMTASYEGWLRVARGGFAPSGAIVNGVMISGVEALKEESHG